jgi:Mg-chelatase subunit ChlD
VFAAIRSLGYTPSPGDPQDFRATEPATVSNLPPPSAVRDAMKRAREEGKPLVVVDCHAPM